MGIFVFQYPITNKEYPTSKEGQGKTLFLLYYLGRCPRLLCYGLSALSAMNHRRYNLVLVSLTCTVASIVGRRI